MEGGCMSRTVTCRLQLAVFPEASTAVQVTVVVPTGKRVPAAGLQDGAPTPGQLSLTAGAGYVTTASQRPCSASRVMLAGQIIDGGWVSFTVTLKLVVAPLWLVQVTTVLPTG